MLRVKLAGARSSRVGHAYGEARRRFDFKGTNSRLEFDDAPIAQRQRLEIRRKQMVDALQGEFAMHSIGIAWGTSLTN